MGSVNSAEDDLTDLASQASQLRKQLNDEEKQSSGEVASLIADGEENSLTANTKEDGLSAADVAQILIDLSEAQERTAKLIDEKKALYEQLARRQAEFENFRKRMERERNELYTKLRVDIIAELLPILDNLERALGSSIKLENAEQAQEGIIAGVRLIHKQFIDVLTNMGLTPISAAGQAFDPHLHEAMTTEVDNAIPENTVIEELQRGYKCGDRLIRPAMVKVSVRG